MTDQDPDTQNELVHVFAQESWEIIEQLEPSIIKLGQEGDKEVFNFIFRHFHSIKVAASFMGLNNTTHVAHQVENFLDHVRTDKIRFQLPKHINLLSLACDFIKDVSVYLQNHSNDSAFQDAGEAIVSKFQLSINETLKIVEESKTYPMERQVQRTLIVGGGSGCASFLPMLQSDKSITIVNVCDLSETAPGVLLAKKMGIPTSLKFTDFLNKNEVDFIIDLTGNHEVNQTLNSIKKPTTEMLGGFGAKLFWELINERKKREEDIERSLAEQEVLYNIGLMLTSAKDIDAVLRRIVLSAIQLSKYTAGSLALYDEKKQEFKMEVAIGFSESFSKKKIWELRKGGLTDYILSNKQPTTIPDISKNTHFDNAYLLNEGIASLIAVPLTLSGKIIGILYVNDFKPKEMNPRIISLMASLTTQATFAIEKNRLLQKAEQLAITDELTQIYNHRYFVHTLSSEIRRSNRLKDPICFLMMDIDNFKYYNDHQGHQNGNIVLKTVASLMQENVREIDILARYGGEEFTVILPGADCKEGIYVAERVRKAIADNAFPFGESQPGGKLTVSIGVANYPEDAANGHELVEKADKALYRAKKEGKNRVFVYSNEI